MGDEDDEILADAGVSPLPKKTVEIDDDAELKSLLSSLG